MINIEKWYGGKQSIRINFRNGILVSCIWYDCWVQRSNCQYSQYQLITHETTQRNLNELDKETTYASLIFNTNFKSIYIYI